MTTNTVKFRGSKAEVEDKSEIKNEDDSKKEETVDLRRSFWLTRVVFLRSLAFIYFVAFLVSFDQNKELIGDNGLLPLKSYLTRIKSNLNGKSNHQLFMNVPTLYWFLESWNHMDPILDATAIMGMVLSFFMFVTGTANSIILALLWLLYHTIVNVGQTWFSFGWESQLLETGFLAIWIVPFFNLNRFDYKPNWLAVLGYRFFVARIMLGAGLIKIRGDKCWHDLTCMNYFFETQPNPNPIAYFAHPAPEAWHKFETFGNHVVELICPFLSFIPLRGAALTNGTLQILFQVILISTGNLSFLNWLTVLPSIWFFDDQVWKKLFSQKMIMRLESEERSLRLKKTDLTSTLRFLTSLVIGTMLTYLSIPIVQNLLSPRQVMNTSFEPFRIVNTYGAFGTVTKERTEIILEGSLDQKDWYAYDFKCKPGNLSQAPCLISPYHYRLDWLMWFAAFQNHHYNPWLLHLCAKLLVNDPIVDSLLLKNPFKGKSPPKFIRARHFKYNFSNIGSEEAQKGQWWTRVYIKDYMPILDLKSVQPYLNHFGWKLKTGKIEQ